jgi:hypothetical protein
MARPVLPLLRLTPPDSLLDDAESCFRRSQAFVEKITEYAAALEGKGSLVLFKYDSNSGYQAQSITLTT